MRKPLLALIAFSLLTGCGTAMNPVAGRAIAHGALAIRSADADKHAVNPPAPLPPRQAFGVSDVTSIASQAYAQAYAAKSPDDAQKIASVALQKIVTMMPGSDVAKQVVPYAQGMLQTKVSDPENAKRLALWPLLYLSKGLASNTDPTFFDLTTKMMESMLNWKDGLAVGLATMDFLNDSSNGYVKTMADKALAQYRNPSNDLQASYKLTLETLKDIGTTLATVKK